MYWEHTEMIRTFALASLALGAVAGCATDGAPRPETYASLGQMSAMYPTMSDVHIRKCDRDGDGQYDNGERACVRSMYLATRNND